MNKFTRITSITKNNCAKQNTQNLIQTIKENHPLNKLQIRCNQNKTFGMIKALLSQVRVILVMRMRHLRSWKKRWVNASMRRKREMLYFHVWWKIWRTANNRIVKIPNSTSTKKVKNAHLWCSLVVKLISSIWKSFNGIV